MIDPEKLAEEIARMRDQLPTLEVGGHTWWIAEGDLRLDAAGLRRFARARLEARGATLDEPAVRPLVAATDADGRIRRWAPGLVLRYCVHRDTFDSDADYADLVQKLGHAAADWEATCGVRFEHAADADGEAETPYDRVVFGVRLKSLPGYVALAFFPGDPREARVVYVDPSWFGTSYDRVGVLRHELGHVLGFRHEHIRGEAPAGCRGTEVFGDATALGDYDPRSVMHYPCGEFGTMEFKITELDREGAVAVYGPPLDPTRFALYDPFT